MDVRLVQHSVLEIDVLQVAVGRGCVLLDEPGSGLVDNRLRNQRNPEVVPLVERRREGSVEIIKDDGVLSSFDLLLNRRRSTSTRDMLRRPEAAGRSFPLDF